MLYWFQVRTRATSLNANEIANGILSSLVAITAGCAFVDYWGACLIGSTLLSFLTHSPSLTLSSLYSFSIPLSLSLPPSFLFLFYLQNILSPPLLLVFAVIFYHCGCFLEYKLGIKDTARVVPVHGVW